ncbi:MAG: hypothetical protein US89_C0007G0037 [Candidatus Peregrinibacteria bacterium GW2011_GWF2_38_29]|nr:MAG: hypothetical protein US89_C0007G0037 [Candidatus Peregrinibacteria bacterium GW2011_GWF2_38_29]HBB02854.1 hypothetical protein [Candidatus Peregrinibacteria bacterium]
MIVDPERAVEVGHVAVIDQNEADERSGVLRFLKSIMNAVGFRANVASKVQEEEIDAQTSAIIVTLSEKEKKILERLFPKGLKGRTKQQNVGNCYFLAVWNSVKKHMLGEKTVSNLFNRKGNEGWVINFPGDDKEIFIGDKEDLTSQDVGGKNPRRRIRRSMQGQKGDVVMERAFGRLRKANKSRDDGDGPMKTMAILDSGWCEEVFRAILGDVAAEVIGIGYGYRPFAGNGYATKILEVFKKQNAHPSKFILTAATPNMQTEHYDEYPDREFDEKRIYYMDSEKHFPCRHAYSIESIDVRTQTLVIVNPWDTEGLKYRITFEKFLHCFGTLEGIELDEKRVTNKFSGVIFHGDSVDLDEERNLKPGIRYVIRGLEKAKMIVGSEQNVELIVNEDGDLEIHIPGIATQTLKKGEKFDITKKSMGGNEYISGNHGAIKYIGNNEVEIKDNYSTNGTAVVELKRVAGYIPQKRLLPGQEEICEMHNKDIEIILADTVTLLCVRREGKILVFQKGRVSPIVEMIPGDMKILGCKEVLDLKKRVSRVHLEVRNLNGHLSVRDVMSKGGTVIRKVNLKGDGGNFVF